MTTPPGGYGGSGSGPYDRPAGSPPPSTPSAPPASPPARPAPPAETPTERPGAGSSGYPGGSSSPAAPAAPPASSPAASPPPRSDAPTTTPTYRPTPPAAPATPESAATPPQAPPTARPTERATPRADDANAAFLGGAAKPPTGAQTAAGNPAAAQTLRGKPRRARLVIRRVDPWSVLKFSLLFSLCLLVVFVVAVAALYYALDSLGVFDSVNQFVRDVTQSGTDNRPTGGFDVTFSGSRIIGGAAVVGAINVVIITAISTLGAFLYNLCSDIVGGIEVTLAERE